MRFEFFLAKRFLAGQRFGVFRLVTTLIAIGGTALGVAALLITLAVMDGFRLDIQEKILGTQPHIVVLNPFGNFVTSDETLAGQLDTAPGVEASAPYINGQALIQTGTKVTGIILRGIEPAAEAKVTRLKEIMTVGRWEDLSSGGIVLGQELAKAISVRLGDPITLITPQENSEGEGFAPRMRHYKVAGIFRSGMYEYDSNLAYISLSSAQDLYAVHNKITGYGLRVKNLDRTASVSTAVQNKLGGQYWVRSWQDLNRPLFSAMKLERTVMFIILTLIILVSSFTIISNLLLLTIEKAREIGILQALGASPQQVGRIFLINGFLLGGSGVGLGLFLGIGLSLLLKKFQFIQLPADVYYIDRLPVRLSATTIESVALCAFGLVLVSVIYPARKARQLDPVQAIRHG
jgi:lipoprotein-releasing system permease protein